MIILIVIGYILLGCLTTLLVQIRDKCEYSEVEICAGICLWPFWMLELIFTAGLPWITEHIYKFFVFVIFSTIALVKRNNSENLNNIKMDEEPKVNFEAMMNCPKCGCYFYEIECPYCKHIVQINHIQQLQEEAGKMKHIDD